MLDASPRSAQLRRQAELLAQSPRALHLQAQAAALADRPVGVAQRERSAALSGQAPVPHSAEPDSMPGPLPAQRVEPGEPKQGEFQDDRTAQLGQQPARLVANGKGATQGRTGSAPQYSQTIIQRVVRPAPGIGAQNSYYVTANDLGNGTGTTPAVRVWAQQNAPGPNPINFRYAAANPNPPGAVVGAWFGPFAAPNLAPAGGANWHAGHILARQNGGFGNIASPDWLMPQDPQVNMGHAGTWGWWRAHEVAFNNLVQVNGAGIWHVW